ncbi:MAG: hypothetical protein KGL53_13700, partial [Elusimicrobia bacterium]|nr:hypothetical protein [Elusimicrobiota bacterium]
LDFSCGDFFPAILQDNKRATVFGVRTSGAGGAVKATQFPNQFGIAGLSYTWTIALRTSGQPIENKGVTPDVSYDLTAEDIANGLSGYVKAVNDELDRMHGGTPVAAAATAPAPAPSAFSVPSFMKLKGATLGGATVSEPNARVPGDSEVAQLTFYDGASPKPNMVVTHLPKPGAGEFGGTPDISFWPPDVQENQEGKVVGYPITSENAEQVASFIAGLLARTKVAPAQRKAVAEYLRRLRLIVAAAKSGKP